MLTQSMKTLSFSAAMGHVHKGAAFVDLRPVDDYLDVHIPESLSLLYEFGPGMQSRARDCIPLEIPLVLLDLDSGDVGHAAASLRGKGFNVLGKIDDGINEWSKWHGTPASTEVVRSDAAPSEGTILHVGDPGTRTIEGNVVPIPIENLWHRVEELAGRGRIYVAAGYGPRAALAVGMLERAGVQDVAFWKTR